MAAIGVQFVNFLSRVSDTKLMLIQLLFIFILGSTSHAADTPCVGKTDPMRGLMDLQNKSCEIRQKSPECQQLYAKIKEETGEEELKSKALNCEKEAKASDLEAFSERLTGCLVGGVVDATVDFWNMLKSVKDAPTKFANSVEEREKRAKECDANPEQKEAIFRVHNQGLPKVLQVPPPADLKSKTCAQLQTLLNSGRRTKNKNAAIHIDGKDRQLGADQLSADEKEYLAWKKDKNREMAAPPSDNLIKLANKKMEELQINYACYSPAAAWAIRCEILYGIATSLTGAGLVKAVAKMAGRKPAVLAANAEKASKGTGKFENVSSVRAADNRMATADNRMSSNSSSGPNSSSNASSSSSSSSSGSSASRGSSSGNVASTSRTPARPSRALDEEDMKTVPMPKKASVKSSSNSSSSASSSSQASSRLPASDATRKAPKVSRTREIKYGMDLDQAYRDVGAIQTGPRADMKLQLHLAEETRLRAMMFLGSDKHQAAVTTLGNGIDRMSEAAYYAKLEGKLTPDLKKEIHGEKTKLLEALHLNGTPMAKASVQQLEAMKEQLALRVSKGAGHPDVIDPEKQLLAKVTRQIDERREVEVKQAAQQESKRIQEIEARRTQEMETQRAQENEMRVAQEREANAAREQEARRVQEDEARVAREQETRRVEEQARETQAREAAAAREAEEAQKAKAARDERMADVRQRYEARQSFRKERDFRNSPSAPKEARPLDTSTRADIEKLVSKMEKDPSSLSLDEVNKLKAIRKDIKQRQSYRDSEKGLKGMMEADEALAKKFESTIDKAATNLHQKQGSSHYLAQQQGRKLEPPKGATGKRSTNSHVPDMRESAQRDLEVAQKTSYHLLDPQLIRFRPVITSGKSMKQISETLEKAGTGITRSELEAVNLRSAANIGDLDHVPFRSDARSFLEKYEKAEKAGKTAELEQSMGSSEWKALQNAVETMRHERKYYVPDYLLNLRD